MKVLLSWLKDYVDIDIPLKALEEKLFSTGFEVEGTEYLGEGIERIFVGEVTSIEKYEGTHLYICHVNCGKEGEDHLILTGADNVFKGAKVPAALVGAKLPGGFEISPRKMKDMVSYGMLCSGGELGLNPEWYPTAGVDGIMILDEDAPVGEDIRTYLGLEDYVLDISITANRPDCQSILGIAREVAAFLGKELKMPDLSYTMDKTTDERIHVDVIDKDLCPRYLGHYIYDIQQVETPLWMKRRLIAVGHNAISVIVDVTNYVLAEIGQPMHAFDLSTVAGRSIIVKRAADGEEIITLDEKKHSLTRNNLLICDTEKGIALAGVMGGLNSEIKDDTKEVLFESAKFVKDNVRKTARGLGIQSDASARYEKGIDEYSVETGMARALNLVQTLGAAKISASHFDVSAGASREERVITVTAAQVNYVLGIQVPVQEMVKILQSLAFGVTCDGDSMTIRIPRYREDIETYQDIAEEVIREYGYDKVVPTFLSESFVTNGGLNAAQTKELEIKKYLCTQGYYEIQTIAMTDKTEFDKFLLDENDSRRTVIELLNPITENLSIMRTMMAPAMLRAIETNIKNGHDHVRFFELANVYIPKSLPLTEAPDEIKTLCLGASGLKEDFFTMKATLESFAADNDLTFVYQRGNEPYFHPGRCADVYCNGQKVGTFGQLRYEMIDKMDIAEGKKASAKIFLAELNYDLLKAQFKTEIVYKPDSGFAKNTRDLSVAVAKTVACGEIIDAIRSADTLVSNVKVFDIFESEKIGPDKKSIAFNITFASDEYDVTDEKAEAAMEKVLAILAEKFDAKRR